MRSCFVVFLLSFYISVFSQNKTIDSLLSAISANQICESNFYKKGMFPSQRLIGKKKTVADNNIFFSALIAFNLKSYEHLLLEANKEQSYVIRLGIYSAYDAFLNKKNNISYNFWMKMPNSHFPNSTILSKFQKFAIPDDFDDTSIIYLSQDYVSNITLHGVAALMALHVNSKKKTIRSTQKQFRKFHAYSTWFGERMPIDFDMCVHANTLLFKLNKQLPLNGADSATARLLCAQIADSLFRVRVSWYSQHYQSAAIVYYHIARTMRADTTMCLFDETYRNKLKDDIINVLHDNPSFMEAILLKNALMFLNTDVAKSEYTLTGIDAEFGKFHFFVANMSSTFPYPFNSIVSKSGFMKQPYICSSYCYSLLLEHEMLFFIRKAAKKY